MDAPLIFTTENGTMFVIKPDEMTEVLRKNQPAFELPTFDLLQVAHIIEAGELITNGKQPKN